MWTWILLLVLLCAVNSTDAFYMRDSHCNMVCYERHLANLSCDLDWMTPECNYDTYSGFTTGANSPADYFISSDWYKDCIAQGWDGSVLGNGTCDEQCEFVECGWDLGDCSICDDGCETAMRGDNWCDDECKSPKCNLDSGDCGWCNESGGTCTSAKQANGSCDTECNNQLCYYDNNDCGGSFCDADNFCHSTMITDGTCDDYCKHYSSCSYDGDDCLCGGAYAGSDCLCAAGCSATEYGNTACDSACDNSACGWDNGVCGYCNSSCTLAHLSNGVCNSVICGTEACSYDMTDCGGRCATNCLSTQVGNGNCNDGCRTISCRYDYPGGGDGGNLLPTWSVMLAGSTGDCNRKQNVLQVVHNLYNKDFTTFATLTDCPDACTATLLFNGTCDTDCNVEACFYDMGTCWAETQSATLGAEIHASCASGCSAADVCKYLVDENCKYCLENECLVCNDQDTNGNLIYQAYGRCVVSGCPPSMYRHTLTERICYPRTSTSNTEGSPEYVYVDGGQTQDSTVHDGTLADPHSSLTGALATVWKSYTTIKLIGTSHDLQPFNRYAFPEAVMNTDADDPFQNISSFRTITKVIIEPQWYTASSTAECCTSADWAADVTADNAWVTLKLPASQLTFDFSFTVEFRWVIFDGSDQMGLSGCTGDFCTYCPKVYVNTATWDDQRQQITTDYGTTCSDFHNTVFIHANGSSAAVLLERVKFFEMRAQYKALIHMNATSQLTMQNVDFEKVQIKGQHDYGVLTFSDITTCPLAGCVALYDDGTVSFMNYGYTYLDDMQQSPFLFIKASLVELTFSNLSFTYNMALVGIDFSEEIRQQGSIIYVEQVKKFTLDTCTFDHNLGSMGIVRVQAIDLDMSGADSVLEHLTVKACTFTYNGSTHGAGALGFVFPYRIQSIVLEDNEFKYNSSHSGSGIVHIENLNYKLALFQTTTSTVPLWQNGAEVSTEYTAITVRIQNNKFEENGSHDQGVLYIKRMPNISIILNNEIKSNTDTDRDLNTQVMQGTNGWITKGYYFLADLPLAAAIPCQTTVFFEDCHGMTLSDFTIDSNSCSSVSGYSAGLAVLGAEGESSTANVIVSNNSATAGTVSGVYVVLGRDITLSGIEVADHVCGSSCDHGSLIITESVPVHLTIQNCSFLRNSGPQDSVAYIAVSTLTLSNNTVEDNESTVGDSTVKIQNPDNSATVTITITGLTWKSNVTNYGNGGLYINSVLSQGIWSTFNFFMTSATFETNNALAGSAIYIGDSVSLSDDSYIKQSTLTNNYSRRSGVVTLMFTAGILLIENSTFIQHRGEGAVIFIQTNVNPCHTEIKDSTFSQNQSVQVQLSGLIFSHLELENNLFEYNIKTGIYNVGGNVVDTSSQYIANDATYGAAVTCSSGGIYTGTSVEFDQNFATEGGSVLVNTQSQFDWTSCLWEKNQAAKGGGIYGENSRIGIVSSSFNGNIASDRGSAYFISNSKATPISTISSSTFQYNNVEKSGTIYVAESSVDLTSITFENNYTQDQTAGVVIVLSTVNIQSSTFSNAGGRNGGFIYASTESSTTITGTTFDNAEVTESGGFLFALNSNTTMNTVQVTNVKANEGAAMTSSFDSVLSITNSVFRSMNSTTRSAILYSYASSLSFEDVYFSSFYPNGIDAVQTNMTINNSQFSAGGLLDRSFGGAIYTSLVQQFNVTNTMFRYLKAQYGGALYFDILKSYQYNLTGNTFFNCEAHQGGAVYNNQNILSVHNCTFQNNSVSNLIAADGEVAIEGTGGAVYTACPAYSDCKANFTNNVFDGNAAENNSGAVKWTGEEPDNIRGEANSFQNNVAEYGTDVGSTPIRLGVINANRLLQDDDLVEIASGQSITSSVCVGIYDDQNQIVKTAIAKGQLLPVNTTTTKISGQTRVDAVEGIFCFNDFTITAAPGTNIELQVETDLFDTTNSVNDANAVQDSDSTSASQINLDLNVALRDCVPGEVLVLDECFICTNGTYSLDPTESQCEECPTGAKCYGNTTMAPQKGYWRANNETEIFYSCPFAAACLGGEIEDGDYSATGHCEKGYQGNKCQACDDNYTRVGKNECGECQDEGGNISVILLIVLAIGAGVVFLVKSTISSANKPKALHSIYMRIFVNYLQVIMLMISFNLSWPTFVFAFLSAQETAGSVTGQIYSLDCITQDFGDLHPYYSKVILMGILPGIFIFFACAFWFVAAAVKRNKLFLQQQLVTTLICVSFLIHPIVVKAMIALFACTEIDDKWYLQDEQDIECWEEEHLFFVTRVSIPALLVWGLGIPLCALYLLVRNKAEIQLDSAYVPEALKMKYGFLFLGYKSSTYYWEFIIMYRKLSIAFVSVFLDSVSTTVQGLVAFMILMICLSLQNHYKPYTHVNLNRLEVYSIITAGTTMYCGLFYLTKSLDEAWNVILFLVILISNAVFLTYWSKYMFAAVFLKVYGAFIRKKTTKIATEMTIFDVEKSSMQLDKTSAKIDNSSSLQSPKFLRSSPTKVLQDAVNNVRPETTATGVTGPTKSKTSEEDPEPIKSIEHIVLKD